jgi:hypothetical protein
VDTALDENQSKLGVLVFAVALQVLSDLHSLLDEHVQIFRDLGCEPVGLEDANHLLSSDRTDLGNTVGVTKNDTNLRGSQTLLGKLADMFFDFGGRGLEPRRRRALVREGTLGDTLSGSMHTTHVDVVFF